MTTKVTTFATLTDAEGNVQWEQDVSEDASPLEESLLPNPSFAHGEWELDIQARGGGESTFGSIQDNFVIIVTITNSASNIRWLTSATDSNQALIASMAT